MPPAVKIKYIFSALDSRTVTTNALQCHITNESICEPNAEIQILDLLKYVKTNCIIKFMFYT